MRYVGYCLVLVFLVLGWRAWKRSARVPAWRNCFAMVALILGSTSLVLFAVYEVPYDYLCKLNRSFALAFYDRAPGFGILFAVLALPLALFGIGRVRVYSALAALQLCICAFWVVMSAINWY